MRAALRHTIAGCRKWPVPAAARHAWVLLISATFSVAALTSAGASPQDKPDTGDASEVAASSNPETARQDTTARAAYETKTLRGEVVWMADALERRFDVTTVPEAEDRILALETEDGALFPIVEDLRGRAFRKDDRLRDRPVELLVRQFKDSPMIQVVRLYALKEDGKYELDYWCDICAIAMFELKACDCCQGPIELRERKVDQRLEAEGQR